MGGDAGESGELHAAIGVGGLPEEVCFGEKAHEPASRDDSREWAALELADGGRKKDGGNLRCAIGTGCGL